MDSVSTLSSNKIRSVQKEMKYILYNENFESQGSFANIEELRRFLCDRKYDIQCDKDIGCTFDYIKHIKWHFEIEE